MSKAEIEATRRRVNRGGIHFYNYYTLPAPSGRIAPVLIDILCPHDRLPTQNNGHLGPAITICLGPGHINGLWGHEINADTWQVFRTNDTGAHSWIAGDSYVEPPYCPHTYARHEDKPTQILSYTIRSNLSPMVAEVNRWSDAAFLELPEDLVDRPSGPALLRSHMERRGFDRASLARLTTVGDNRLSTYLEGDEAALDFAALRMIGRALGFDYRLLMPPEATHDPVGKTWCSATQSVASIRSFKSYTVASMAASPQNPDFMGLFMRVEKPAMHRNSISSTTAQHIISSRPARSNLPIARPMRPCAQFRSPSGMRFGSALTCGTPSRAPVR